MFRPGVLARQLFPLLRHEVRDLLRVGSGIETWRNLAPEDGPKVRPSSISRPIGGGAPSPRISRSARSASYSGQVGQRLGTPMKNRYRQVPWREIVGMRHRVVHDYFAVDLDILWVAASIDVPRLAEQVRGIVYDLTSHG